MISVRSKPYEITNFLLLQARQNKLKNRLDKGGRFNLIVHELSIEIGLGYALGGEGGDGVSIKLSYKFFGLLDPRDVGGDREGAEILFPEFDTSGFGPKIDQEIIEYKRGEREVDKMVVPLENFSVLLNESEIGIREIFRVHNDYGFRASGVD
jgi:hypothetical protein